jgi:hypothetical protein
MAPEYEAILRDAGVRLLRMRDAIAARELSLEG